MTILKHQYLIIGGAPKAGTTSLYKWLTDHPQVCGSSLKETRFFLDVDYPLPSIRRFDGTNLKEYDILFKHCQDDGQLLRVEATPDYLYAKTALHVAELMPNAKIVFILRDPVERMVSWYKYARQRGLIRKSMTFEDYIMEQVRRKARLDTPIHLRALDQCRYEKYLPAFREAFGERCMVVDFKEIKVDPRGVMTKICAFAGLDEYYYNTYTFRAENVSHSVRIGWILHGYSMIRRRLVHALYGNPVVMDLLRKPNRVIKKVLAMNIKDAEKVNVTAEMSNLILQEAGLKNEGTGDCKTS